MNTTIQTPEFWIAHLNLTAHPEGGYFSEIYRNKEEISDKELTQSYSGKRSLATSIYFLLKSGQVSKLHRLKSDEIWYYHYGAPLKVHVFHERKYTCYRMGNQPLQNELFQVVLPAGSIFGAEVDVPDSYTLVGCMVSPGFHFNDFELIGAEELYSYAYRDPQLVTKLT